MEGFCLFVFLQTVKCIVGSTEEQLSAHFTVLDEESETRSSYIICIYLFITNNICKNSVKEQGVEVPLRIQKNKIILSLINIMLIYILYCSPKTWVVILESTSLFLLIVLMLSTQTTMFMISP